MLLDRLASRAPVGLVLAPLLLLGGADAAGAQEVGPLAPATTSPTPEPVADDDGDGRPTDDLVRLAQLGVGAALLLGLTGAAGLYLTREPRSTP